MEQEIKNILDLLTSKPESHDVNLGLTKSLQRIMHCDQNDPDVSRNVGILRDLKQMLHEPTEEGGLKKKTSIFPRPTDTRQFIDNLHAIVTRKSKSESIDKNKPRPPCKSRSDASFSSEEDYDTICEETVSEQSSNESTVIHTGYVDVPLGVAGRDYSRPNIKSLIDDYNALSATPIDDIDLSATPSDYSSLKAAPRPDSPQTSSARMIEFLDVITSFSFDSIRNDAHQHAGLHQIIQRYCICRLQHIIHNYHSINNYLIGCFQSSPLSTDLIRATHDLQALPLDTPRRNYRLMSFHDEGLRRYTSLPEFDLADDMFLKQVCSGGGAKSLETLLVDRKRVESLCQTMVLNLQLLRPPKMVSASVRSLQRRRRQRTKLLTQVGRRKRADAVTETVGEAVQGLVMEVRGKKLRSFTSILVLLYLVVFVTVFCSLALNFNCE